MTEKEAIKHLRAYRNAEDRTFEYFMEFEPKAKISDRLGEIEMYNLAIQALEEIQQYRAIGTVEEIKQAKKYIDLKRQHKTPTNTIDVCAEYVAIGTVEECREAVERQKPKKPEDVEYDYSYFICPVCGDGIYVSDDYEIHKFCLNCGQAIDWSEEDEIPGRNVP